MKIKNTFVCLVLCLTGIFSFAQVASNIKPLANGKMGEFTEWKKVDVSWDDGTTATVEYRIALATRKGIGCHYDLEVKNTSDMKLNIRMKSHYYDKLVKSNFGDEIKESLKPGKSLVGRLVAQGCRKDKGFEGDDYASCMACEFYAELFVSK